MQGASAWTPALRARCPRHKCNVANGSKLRHYPKVCRPHGASMMIPGRPLRCQATAVSCRRRRNMLAGNFLLGYPALTQTPNPLAASPGCAGRGANHAAQGLRFPRSLYLPASSARIGRRSLDHQARTALESTNRPVNRYADALESNAGHKAAWQPPCNS
jgi:hypothetical protein